MLHSFSGVFAVVASVLVSMTMLHVPADHALRPASSTGPLEVTIDEWKTPPPRASRTIPPWRLTAARGTRACAQTCSVALDPATGTIKEYPLPT